MPEKTQLHGVAKLFENYSEVTEPSEAQVEGQIPPWLDVTILRNGPGMFRIGDTEYSHWFDGLAFIQRYFFQEGKMFYSARYLESEAYKINIAANRIVVGEFGTSGFTDPCKGFLGKLQTFFSEEHVTDNASVNFFSVGDTVWAATETPRVVRVDPKNIKTLDNFDFNKTITLHTFTAHQQYDLENNVYHIGSRFGKNTDYVFTVTKNPKRTNKSTTEALEETSIVAEIQASESLYPAYYHSFGMTENYFILFESPLRLDLKRLIARKILNISFKESMVWRENSPIHIRVIDKRSGKEVERKFRHDSLFSFHQANAFEKDGFIIMDYCAMERAGNLSQFDLKEIRSGGLAKAGDPKEAAYCYRMIIPLDFDPKNLKENQDLLKGKDFAGGCKAIWKNGEVWLQQEKLSEYAFEFPKINMRENLKPHRFIYGAGLEWNSGGKVSLVKVDTVTRKTITWKRDHDEQIAGEPLFVQAPGAKDEDEGVILAPILNFSDDDTPFVLVLNAKNFEELARCRVNHRVPLGFHAQVYPN
ncbi:hypothetical protein FO519_008028 [Halicephalobus sp. NKZ332]|nr:hypothetical protein FO519_008028 [Halicephalobus sp. NKZ332]